MKNTQTRDKSSAFTLIELLIVITILLILVAILLPAIFRAREKTMLMVGLSNQRQVFMGALFCLNLV